MRRGGSTRIADYRRVAGKQQNTFRIVGGRHRGRRLAFPDIPGLRPSPDRVRETVFNWLQPLLPGARVLDLFAGSGAFGLESLSRGAAEVTLVEIAPQAVRELRRSLETLGESATIHPGDALAWLESGPAGTYDIVFLDPPYQAGLLQPALERLAAGDRLAPAARVYIECAREHRLPDLPDGWQVLKEKTAGDVRYHLVTAP